MSERMSPCLTHCSRIHRYVDPAKWAEEIERVPDDCREYVRQYLRVIWQRAKVARETKAKQQPNDFGFRRK